MPLIKAYLERRFMGKEILVSNKSELAEYTKAIHNNLQKSLENIKSVLDINDCTNVFERFKYDKTAIDPLTGNPENLIEVINQYQTYLVTIKALDYLFERYPDKSFVARFGNIAGNDIESTDGKIVAECFAQVSYKNNKKLEKDLVKLNSAASNSVCYEFFYDKVFTEEVHLSFKSKYPKINIVKFETLK